MKFQFTPEEVKFIAQVLELLAYQKSQAEGQQGEGKQTQSVVQLASRIEEELGKDKTSVNLFKGLINA